MSLENNVRLHAIELIKLYTCKYLNQPKKFLLRVHYNTSVMYFNKQSRLRPQRAGFISWSEMFRKVIKGQGQGIYVTYKQTI